MILVGSGKPEAVRVKVIMEWDESRVATNDPVAVVATGGTSSAPVRVVAKLMGAVADALGASSEAAMINAVIARIFLKAPIFLVASQAAATFKVWLSTAIPIYLKLVSSRNL